MRRVFLLGLVAGVVLAGMARAEAREARRARVAHAAAGLVGAEALRRAVEDMETSFAGKYAAAEAVLKRLDELEAAAEKTSGEQLKSLQGQLEALRREALLANPLLDGGRILIIERRLGEGAKRAMGDDLGVGTLNAHTNDSLRRTGWDNQVAVLSDLRGKGELKGVYRPEGGKILTDLDLHFDGERIMFSSIGKQGNWRVFEVKVDGSGLRQVTPDDGADVGHFDSCYLPDGRIVFDSTAAFQGLPCEFGGRQMANLFLLDEKSGQVRQLTFEQDSDWCPTMLNNGRVLYQRWEYTDLPHTHSRRLFHMNPDGTEQMEFYGSNGYFPNSFFYARAIPGQPTAVVGIAGGHHGTPRSGRMLILDPARGRSEAEGVVQEIPGWGKKVEPLVRDNLVDGVWPQFLHPYPLSDKYFLVSIKPRPDALWGVYLVDVFDNLVLIKEVEGSALLEPILVQRTPTPPVVPDKVDLARKDGTVYLADVYHGPGLAGVPRGTIKKLRIVGYHFSYRGMGGLLGSIGMDGPWDIKRVLGTVPVEADGSAAFVVPANTPLTLQPLDAEGKAVALMRSWFTAMPGEVVTCNGCHDRQNSAPPARPSLAARKDPAPITPWYGPTRGFNFSREVQPVIDRYCVGCHDGQQKDRPDLRGTVAITDWSSQISGHVDPRFGGKFSVAYAELHRYVRRPGIESDIHLLRPMEYHADQTELVRMLQKGHHNVQLDAEAWDRLITWIDLNAPFHGTWTEIVGREAVERVSKRARELARKYANVDEDREYIPPPPAPVSFVMPAERIVPAPAKVEGWPFSPDEARARQSRGGEITRTLDLGDGLKLELVRVPAGRFVMGDPQGFSDERATAAVEIERPFWMGRFEITNEQYAKFDAKHDSHVESLHGYQFGVHGYPLDRPKQPVVRVSQQRAKAFCRWLAEKTGARVALPSEAQWEWACRAGSAEAFSFGNLSADFSKHANLGDVSLRQFAADTYVPINRITVLSNPNRYDDWVPKEAGVDDKALVTADVGLYAPNAWGLFDMHGNAWEWTRSSAWPYPYREDDGRNAANPDDKMIARGGSWYDRPIWACSAARVAYRPWQPVYNVGFRVVVEE